MGTYTKQLTGNQLIKKGLITKEWLENLGNKTYFTKKVFYFRLWDLEDICNHIPNAELRRGEFCLQEEYEDINFKLGSKEFGIVLGLLDKSEYNFDIIKNNINRWKEEYGNIKD